MNSLSGLIRSLLLRFVPRPILVGASIESIAPPTKEQSTPMDEAILNLNRNARAPKKANHGARPCSSVMRRMKKKSYYRRWKENTPAEQTEQEEGGTDDKADVKPE